MKSGFYNGHFCNALSFTANNVHNFSDGLSPPWVSAVNPGTERVNGIYPVNYWSPGSIDKSLHM